LIKPVTKHLLFAGLVVGSLIMSLANAQDDKILSNIAPVDNLCMSGDDCAAAPVAAGPAEPRTGDEIYAAACGTCHTAGVSGAPRTGNVDDWAPRIAQGNESMFTNAWNGYNAMPAKGLCMDCSEDEIRAAIAHMVDQSQ
jgi:cytochrome c5